MEPEPDPDGEDVAVLGGAKLLSEGSIDISSNGLAHVAHCSVLPMSPKRQDSCGIYSITNSKDVFINDYECNIKAGTMRS